MPLNNLSYTVEYKPSSAWVAISGSTVLDISGDLRTSNGDNPLGFGDGSDARMTVRMARTSLPTPYYLVPIRASYTVNGSTAYAFVGVMLEYSGDEYDVDVECVSFAELIRTIRAYSPMFKARPVATKTTTTSIDDPTSGSYAGGLMNYLLWQAGGRPYEQNATYTTATFYYSCDNAILAPPYSWTAGDDAWSECQKLAQAAGGQLYQDEVGTIRYRQPLSFGSGTATKTYTDSDYVSIEISSRNSQRVASVNVPFVRRSLQPLQDVIDDNTKRLIRPSATDSFTIETKYPVASYTVNNTGFTILHGDAAAVSGTHYSWSADTTAAQRVVFTFTNLTSQPLQIMRIKLQGRPVTAGESGLATVGIGNPTRNLGENEFVQSYGDALRIANMVYTFYFSERPIYRVKGCLYDVARTIGEVVQLTSTPLGLSAARCLAIGKSHSGTGDTVDWELVYVGDLYTSADMFIVGTTYAGTDTRRLSY